MEPTSQEFNGRVIYFRQQCQCDTAVSERKHQEDEKKKRNTIDLFNSYILKAGNIHIGRYARMTFDNWDTTRHEKSSKHIKDVLEFCDTYDHERNLLWLWGEYGTGKTHLALAALRKLVWDAVLNYEDFTANVNQPTAHFTEWIIHCSKVQQSWDDNSTGESEARLWSRMNNVAFLVIDDIDKRTPSEWAMGKLYEVIHHRYMNEKLTIITANHKLNDLDNIWLQRGGYVADIGSAILSRITGQLWAEVEITGGDQRAR